MEIKKQPQMGKVVIASHLIRQSERLDKNGNVVDPNTGEILKANKEEK